MTSTSSAHLHLQDLCDSGLRREVGLESLFFKDLDLDLECEDLDLGLDLSLKDLNDIYKLRPPTFTILV